MLVHAEEAHKRLLPASVPPFHAQSMHVHSLKNSPSTATSTSPWFRPDNLALAQASFPRESFHDTMLNAHHKGKCAIPLCYHTGRLIPTAADTPSSTSLASLAESFAQALASLYIHLLPRVVGSLLSCRYACKSPGMNLAMAQKSVPFRLAFSDWQKRLRERACSGWGTCQTWPADAGQ